MRAFFQADRFVGEIESRKLRPAYVFVGDEAFFRKRFRDAIHVPLHREQALWRSEPAKSPMWRGIGGDRPGADADARPVVRAARVNCASRKHNG